MSILLNAINKSRQDNDTSVQEDDKVDSEIGDLIDSPMDEYPTDENRSLMNEITTKPMKLITALLVVISVFLFTIIILLVIQQWGDDRNSRQSSGVLSEPIKEESPNKAATVQPLPAKSFVPEQSKRAIGAHSAEPEPNQSVRTTASNTPDSNIDDSKTNYLESYQPTRRAPAPIKKRSDSKNKTTRSRQPKPSANIEGPKDSISPSLAELARVKTMSQLSPAELQSAQQVRLDAHVYSEDVSKSFVFINGKLKQTGDDLVEGWVLDKIDEDSIIISNGPLKVRKENQN